LSHVSLLTDFFEHFVITKVNYVLKLCYKKQGKKQSKIKKEIYKWILRGMSFGSMRKRRTHRSRTGQIASSISHIPHIRIFRNLISLSFFSEDSFHFSELRLTFRRKFNTERKSQRNSIHILSENSSNYFVRIVNARWKHYARKCGFEKMLCKPTLFPKAAPKHFVILDTLIIMYV